jgi:hypothetical protein
VRAIFFRQVLRRKVGDYVDSHFGCNARRVLNPLGFSLHYFLSVSFQMASSANIRIVVQSAFVVSKRAGSSVGSLD